MKGLNKVVLAGALGLDPELKQTDDGPALALRLATNESYRDKNDQLQTWTEWHTVLVKGHRATKLDFLKKGMKVYLECVLRERRWTCEQGIKHNFPEIHLVDLMLLENKTPVEDKE